MEDGYVVANELALLALTLVKEFCGVFDSFFSFLKKYEGKKTHNMVSLMLDLKFKNLHIVSSFVGKEHGVVVVQEYDKISISYVGKMS
jgi:hypothetical protein